MPQICIILSFPQRLDTCKSKEKMNSIHHKQPGYIKQELRFPTPWIFEQDSQIILATLSRIGCTGTDQWSF